MSRTHEIDWAGVSGETYGYFIDPIGTKFLNVPGNYVFAFEPKPGYWQAVYVGESDSLGKRLTNAHEKLAAAVKLGATHIHTHVNDRGEDARLAEEVDLIVRWNPPLNTQSTTWRIPLPPPQPHYPLPLPSWRP